MAPKLEKLVLKNFKSFQKADITLNKGFTCVVGGNGKGKSNILDALLFVLGSTSMKLLRAGKLSDLVNDSCKEKYAKVDLIISENGKKYEVSRMIDDQGRGIYRLDGKRVTLNEIEAFLVGIGVVASGRNVITQGDVTKIINMAPLERRQMIDDVAGLQEFDEKKAEAIKELDRVDSRIKEATIVLNERNGFLEDFEKDMKDAKEHTTLENEKRNIKATLIQREVSSLDKRMSELEQSEKTFRTEKQAHEEEIVKTRNEILELRTKASELGKQMLASSDETYANYGKNLEKKKSLLAVEKEKLSSQEKQMEFKKKRIETIKTSLGTFEGEKKELSEKTEGLKKEITEISTKLTHALAEKKRLEAIVEKKTSELSIIEAEKEKLSNEKNEIFAMLFNEKALKNADEKQSNLNKDELRRIEERIIPLKTKQSEMQSKKNRLIELETEKPTEIEKTLSEKIQSLEKKSAETQGQIDAENKSIHQLLDSKAKCPVCYAGLDEEKKISLSEEKKKIVAELKNKEHSFWEEISKTKIEFGNIKKKIDEISMLKAQIQGSEFIETELNSLEERKNKLKNWVPTFNATKIEELEKKITTFEEKITEENKRAEAFRAQNIFSEYSSASREVEGLMNSKASIEFKLKEIEAELNSGLGLKEKIHSNEMKQLERDISTIEKNVLELTKSISEMTIEVQEIEKNFIESKNKSAEMSKEKDIAEKKLLKVESGMNVFEQKIKKVDLKINEIDMEKMKASVRLNDLNEEKKNYENAEILPHDVDWLRKRLAEAEKRLIELGQVNMKAIVNYEELKKEVDDIQQKATKLADERLKVLDMIDKIEVKRTEVFNDCFIQINKNFNDMFFKFFNGEAKLSLSNPESPLDSGLIIEAKHKGFNFKGIDSMSGGEKTLTALAFMFAIQFYSPATFYAFDEADAALDKENSLKMGELIKSISKKSQVIAVTHNDTITKLADQMVGVASKNNISVILGLKLNKDQQKDEAEAA